MYCYLQNVKTNVSNAKRKRPKVIKSLKSKWFFIGITPILTRMRSTHPATRLFLVSYTNTVLRKIQFYISNLMNNQWCEMLLSLAHLKNKLNCSEIINIILFCAWNCGISVLYWEHKRGTTAPQGGLTCVWVKNHLLLGQSLGWFFLCKATYKT